MRRARWWFGVLCTALGCAGEGSDAPEPGTSASAGPGATSPTGQGTSAAATRGTSEGTGSSVGVSSSGTGDTSIGTPDPPKLDVGSADTGSGGSVIDCENTTANAAIALQPCVRPIAVAPPFADDYSCFQVANIPELPPSYGGSVFSLGDPDLLLIGGDANTATGALYAMRVSRDPDCHVTGFIDAAPTQVAAAEYNDGGMAYAPNGTMLLARWPVHELGQLALGAIQTSKIIDLSVFAPSGDQGIAAVAFVPGGFAAEGRFKVMTWSGGVFYDVVLADDGTGQTFDIVSATQEAVLGGGPEGFVYVDDSSPQIAGPSMLVSEWSAGFVTLYDVDMAGVPLIDTRQEFITGLSGAEGAHIDPTSGDFLFTTFGGGNVIVTIRGFEAPPPPAG